MSDSILSNPGLAADEQARLLARLSQEHRREVQTLINSRAGMCMANGWTVSVESFDGDFDFDEAIVPLLLNADSRPSLRAAPAQRAAVAPQRAVDEGPSALQQYLLQRSSTAPLGSSQRLRDEADGATRGPGNVLANAATALTGLQQLAGERDSARLLKEGLREILAGSVKVVKIAPGVELYNSAQGKQKPRVRLRIRNLPVKVVTQAIPAAGGAVTQWRFNKAGSTASLKAGSMTAQQLRNTSVLAGQQRLAGALRWSQGRLGGGILTFAPSLALDTYNAIEVDLQGGGYRFNGQKFVEDSARSQSGNVVGVLGTAAVVAVAGVFVAGPPLVLIGLAGGIGFQALWNWSGGADAAADAASQALH